MTGRRLHRILLGVALALWTAAAGATTQKCDLIYYTKRFISKGKSIRAEIVRPSYGTHPAVLFIHGTGGLLTRAALERRSVPPVDGGLRTRPIRFVRQRRQHDAGARPRASA